MTPSILIVGAAGFTNLGDDAILAAMLDELGDAVPGARFTVAGGGAAYGSESLSSIPVETIEVRDVRAVDAAVARSDLVILGGGGFIYDYDAIITPYDFLRGDVTFMYPYYRAAVSASVRGVPLYAYAVGIDSLVTPAGRALTRDVLSRAQAITVRDELSLLELRRAGVRCPVIEVTADPAIRIEAPEGTWGGRPAGRVVVFVTRPWLRFAGTWTESASHHYDTYVGWLAAAADHAVERWDSTPIFLPGQRYADDDLETAAAVTARMHHGERALHLEEIVDERQYRAVLAGADAVVSSRLHPLILAATATVPIVGLAITEKVRAFLVALGLGGQLVSPWAASAPQLEAAIDRAVGDADPLREALRGGVARQRERAARNPAIAADLLRQPVATS